MVKTAVAVYNGNALRRGGVYIFMKGSRVIRFAFLAFAVVQVIIFGCCGFSQHAQSVATAKRKAQSFEYFYCIELKRSYPAVEERGFGECWPSPQQKYIVVTNLPVFVTTLLVTGLIGTKLRVRQVPLFYALNAIGIPLFWYGIGAVLARVTAKKSQASPTPRSR